MQIHSSLARGSWLAVALSLVLSGCDGGSPLSRGGGPTTPPQPESVSEIVLVLPGENNTSYDLWARMAQFEAGRARVIFNVARPEVNDPPERQAELIREVMDRAVSALIVVPGDPEVIGPVLAEARDRGIVVIALGEPIPLPDGAPPVVVREPLQASAEAAVAKLLEDAEAAGLPPSGPAQIVVCDTTDRALTAPRAEALRAALEEAGVTVRPDAHIEKLSELNERIGELMQSEEPPVLILATDGEGVASAVQYRASLEPAEQERMLVAGYSDVKEMLFAVDYGMLNAGIDTNLRQPAVEAVRLALEGIRGETLPDRVEIPLTVLRAEGPIRSDAYPAIRNRPSSPPTAPTGDGPDESASPPE